MTQHKVRFTATAREHVRLFKRWWQENSSRPEIFQQDLEEAVKTVSLLPGIGSLYRAASTQGVRRLYIERLVSHLYYTFDDREVIVQALWHARRGAGPGL